MFKYGQIQLTVEYPSGASDLSLRFSKASRHLACHEDEIGIVALTVGKTQMISHKKAHENYCFSSPSLQSPPTLQIATEDHLQNIVAGFWVGVFGLFCFFFLDGKSKQGRNTLEGTLLPIQGKGVEILGFCLFCLICFWFQNPASKIPRSGSCF